MMRSLAALLGALALSGCITPYPDLTQSRSPCRSEPGGWCDFVREAAVKSYVYAMLSSNAYKDEDEYAVLPPGIFERESNDNDDSGLAYSVFDRFHPGSDPATEKPLARVIAFRGTEFGSASDIFSGSLGDRQRNRARLVYQVERSGLDEDHGADIPIEVTGHSLGGALATQISIENAGVRAFVFNTSPFFSGDPMQNDNDRLAIAERDEFLRVLRRYKAQPAANVVLLNCQPSASAGQKHSIRRLADCLVWIAAYQDKQAFDLLDKDNDPIVKPEIECGDADKAHPGSTAQTEPCIHAPMANTKRSASS